MGLRFDPIGGGQFKQAVQAIMDAESIPLKAMNTRKSKEEAKVKLFQEFKGKFTGLDKTLGELASFRKFRELKVDLGDGSDLVSVTIDKDKADTGQYLLEIDKMARRTSMISNGLENPDEPIIGAGFISLELENGDTSEIYVDEKHSSLHGIATLINSEKKSPIQAAVIQDVSDPDESWKLVLTGKKDGEAHQLEYPEFHFLDGSVDFYVDDDVEAENAELSIDGFDIESGSNQITDFLPGVNLHIKEADSKHPFTVSITEDFQKITGKVKAAVDQINQVLQFIIGQNTVDASSDTTTTFTGDTSLQTLEYQIRNIVHQGFAVSSENADDDDQAVYLNQLGFEFDKKGQIQLKEDKFTKEMEGNFNLVAGAMSGPNGFVNQIRNLVGNYTRPSDGLLSYKDQALKARIKDIDSQIEQKNRMLDQRRKALVDQFSRLEGTIGAMQKQQQYLAAALPGAGGGSMISQLLG